MKLLKHLIPAFICLLLLILVFNDHFLYDAPIVKITDVRQENEEGLERYVQHISGIIKNGEFKGNTVSFDNTATRSQVYGDNYRTGTELFVSLSPDGSLVTSVIGVKRDKYIAILFVIFLLSVIYAGRIKGLKALLSMAVNMIIAALAIWFYINGFMGMSVLSIFMIASFIFIITSLCICNGFGKKTLAAAVSSLISVLISFILAYMVIAAAGSGISYWTMDYADVIHDYKGIFYMNILISGLGAIMDISITMASSLNELIEKDPSISLSALKSSGRSISRDIMGTMTNVMLFTCFISVIPIVVLAIRNWMTLPQAISSYGELEMIRTLTSCIGIVISIPVSLMVSLFILGRRQKHD